MSLDEIRFSKKPFLRIEDVCGILPCCPKTLRKQLHHNPESVQFPVIKLGNRYFIPRKQFIDYMDGADKSG